METGFASQPGDDNAIENHRRVDNPFQPFVVLFFSQ